jgi:tetratricopeptide (TPR) repeat protein
MVRGNHNLEYRQGRQNILFRVFLSYTLLVAATLFAPSSFAQQTEEPWVTEVRKDAESHEWDKAMKIVDEQLALHPDDMDIRAWRARILAWSGKLTDAEREYDAIVKVEKNDPDNWIGLAGIYLQQGRLDDALKVADRAVELDPKRADLRETRARILRMMGQRSQARLEFQRALTLDPSSADARSELSSLRGDTKNELRIGVDNDSFSFAPSNHDQWATWVSRWTPNWTTSFGGDIYQRDGVNADKFEASVTRSQPRWGALTIGGATAHDNAVIPETEAFFELDHGFKFGETGFIRGVEVVYNQHWYWYTVARILADTETGIVYLPKDWTFTIQLIEARSHFSGTGINWEPSGLTRLNFPIARWNAQSLSGNVFYAVGTEDFAQVDQIGSFASHTYGGGFRYQFTARQDITGYGAFQQRTQDRAQTSFGFSYGIRF